jgi:glucose-1-phosphate adenylyltransferase
MSAADLARGKHFLASMGIYIFNRQALINIFDAIPTAKDFGKEIIPGAIHSGLKVASFQFNGYWTDIGTIKSFYEANIALTDDVPAYNMFDSKQRVFTRPRILAPSKVFGTRLHRSLMAEGCICHADTIEQSIIGIRSRIGPGTKIYSSIIMGADYYESIPQLQLQDNIPIGIGQNCLVSRAILDKNCRIGNNVRIVGHESLPDAETETYCTRDGIVVVKKNAVIPDDSRIGMHA